MNILMLTRDVNVLRDGTAARRAIEEYATLPKHLFVIVLNTRRDHFKIQKVSDKLWIYPCNAFAWWSTPFAAVRVAGKEVWFQNRLQVDIVHALDPSESGLAGAFIMRFSKKPLLVEMLEDVLDARFQDESFTNLVRAFIARYVLRRANSIRVALERTKESLEEISPAVAKKAYVLPRFVDIAALAREPMRVDLHTKYPRYHFVILMVAPLVRENNLALGIHVLVGALRHFGHTGLVIVGEGPDRTHLERLAQQLHVKDRVVFEKRTADIGSYYKSANVFLMPVVDGLEQSLREAVACGALVVSANAGVAPRIIENGVNGFLCAPDDTKKFIDTVADIIRRPGVRETIKINARVDIEGSEGKEKELYLQHFQDAWERLMPEQ